MEDQLILVNEKDEEIGSMGKMAVHQKGLLHRAFSVFIFNSAKQLLLQRRALTKYHSAGLWSNTCCSHPILGEEFNTTVARRLKEEMGVIAPVKRQFSFIYSVEFENGLKEHELDHVFVGTYEDNPRLDPDEAMDYKWIDYHQLIEWAKEKPQDFTYWFRLILEQNGQSIFNSTD